MFHKIFFIFLIAATINLVLSSRSKSLPEDATTSNNVRIFWWFTKENFLYTVSTLFYIFFWTGFGKKYIQSLEKYVGSDYQTTQQTNWWRRPPGILDAIKEKSTKTTDFLPIINDKKNNPFPEAYRQFEKNWLYASQENQTKHIPSRRIKRIKSCLEKL